ncbi:hypothetical protein O9X98_04985 [Agrobacterium salinitolerans]|nr:hypothetical protein [Agrobacterium salinitolerans]
MRAKVFVCATLMALAASGQGVARDYEVVSIKAGETAEVYFQVNLEGTLFLNIRTKDGEGCANLTWKTGPLFIEKDEGRHCGFVKLDIPGFFDFAVWSTLYATAEGADMKIGYSASEKVAHSITFEFP